jgi:hypothetical protein
MSSTVIITPNKNKHSLYNEITKVANIIKNEVITGGLKQDKNGNWIKTETCGTLPKILLTDANIADIE